MYVNDLLSKPLCYFLQEEVEIGSDWLEVQRDTNLGLWLVESVLLSSLVF